MRKTAHIGTSVSPPAASGGPVQRAPSTPADRQPRHRLDDLVREIGGRGIFGGRAAPLAWGFAGFLIGAIFWHVIGFWGFLSEAVLEAPEPQVSVVAREVKPAVPPNCTTLALNRATGETTSVPCADQTPLLEEARMGRHDLALAGKRLGDAAPVPSYALARGP